MRIALAAIFQITNTFARQQASLDDFIVQDYHEFDSAPDDPFGVGRVIRALLDAGSQTGHAIEPILAAVGRTSGPVGEAALEQLQRLLVDRLSAIATEIDVVILILSGAALDVDGQSADRSIISVIRACLPETVPVVALFSLEARLSEGILEVVNLPLVIDPASEDLDDRACQTIERSERLVAGQIAPSSALRRLPLLLSYAARRHGSDALTGVSRLAAEFEDLPDVLGAHLIPGFPYADVPDAGARILVTTDGQPDKAAQMAERLKSALWDVREEFAVVPANVETVVHEAMLSQETPVVIFESGDDPAAGAACDGTGLLWALIDLGAPDAALGVIVDPAAIDQAVEAGVGSTLQLDIGGGLDRRAGYPVNVTATVRRLSDSRECGGPWNALAGRAVLLDVQGRHGGQIDLIVTERAPFSVDPSLFAAMGVDLSAKRIVGVKSSGQNRASYESIASQILETSTPGITTPSLTYLKYRNVPGSVFPLNDLERHEK